MRIYDPPTRRAKAAKFKARPVGSAEKAPRRPKVVEKSRSMDEKRPRRRVEKSAAQSVVAPTPAPGEKFKAQPMSKLQKRGAKVTPPPSLSRWQK